MKIIPVAAPDSFLISQQQRNNQGFEFLASYARNPPITDGFHVQMASNVEMISMALHHYWIYCIDMHGPNTNLAMVPKFCSQFTQIDLSQISDGHMFLSYT